MFFLVIELNSKSLFILTQFNRRESRHAVARAICHGQKGEIRKRYQDGQEDQLGALGLVTNAVVLWNTIYIQAALDHLRNVSTPRCYADDFLDCFIIPARIVGGTFWG